MSPAWRRVGCLALNLAYLGACTKSDATSSPGAAPASATASAAKLAEPSAPKPPAPSVSSEDSQAKPGCRALAISGVSRVDGVPLSPSSLLDGTHWVELESGASVALRHTQTSREFRLIGPGHVLPCRDGSEQILLADGQLSTSAMLGVRPGAEVLIATPAGVVRYGDAALDLSFGGKGLRVRVKQGEAWVEPGERSKPHFENPLRSGAEARVPASDTAEPLVAACQSAAQTAESSARRVLDGEAEAGRDSLGVRAAAHMRQRAKARVACAIAAAAAFTERDPATRQRLSASVVHADVLWQSVPRVSPERPGKN